MNSGSGQPSILVVSQDPIARDIHAQFLRMAAYDVITAESGERALLMLRQLPRRIEWLFTTIRLPGLVDGWMLADEFHRLHPRKAVILASDADSDRLMASDQVLFVPNPVSPVELVAQVHTLSGRHAISIETPSALPLVARTASVPPASPAPRQRPAAAMLAAS